VIWSHLTLADHDGGKLHWRQAVGPTLSFQCISFSTSLLSLFLLGTLPARVFATRLVEFRKATSAVVALKSLAVVWETEYNPRRKSHLAYRESFSNMLRGNFSVHPNICAQIGRKHLTRFPAWLRLPFQNTVSNRLKLCRCWTVVRAVSKFLRSYFFSFVFGWWDIFPKFFSLEQK
jgi:hypothetical protein